MKRTILYNNIDGNLRSPHNQYHVDDDEPDGGSSGPFVPLEETMNLANSKSSLDHTLGSSNLNKTATAKSPALLKKGVSPTVTGVHKNLTLSSAAAAGVPSTAAVAASATPLQGPQPPLVRILSKLDAKKVISSTVFTLIFLLVWDSVMSSPESRVLQPDFANTFLTWVQAHPSEGLIWILLVMSVAVIFMIPIGTPLTLGCGYIYKGAYGWKIGVLIATCVSMLGSALGAVVCFLLGRYLMRDMVKKWIRKYPIFDAIDIAATEHGLRIMAMLYLTPILPLGPVSYMCGTTSLKLSHFVLAKVAALPLMMLYVLIGASTGTLISTSKSGDTLDKGGIPNDQVKSIEENETLIIAGILLSFASIAGITHYIKKELNQILERQKRQQHNNIEIVSLPDASGIYHIKNDMENAISTSTSSAMTTSTNLGSVTSIPVTPPTTILEMGSVTTAPRQRKH
jgi:uncharacterized membrane protein YdjX (TVP38/TMEM64 family)